MGLAHQFFLKLSMVLEAHVLLRVTAGFFFFNFLFQKWGKWAKNGPRIGFFRFIGTFSHFFFLSLVYKESSYYMLYSCTDPTLRKNLVPEIWVKMLSANQTAGFLNWLYLQRTIIKKPDFCMLAQITKN